MTTLPAVLSHCLHPPASKILLPPLYPWRYSHEKNTRLSLPAQLHCSCSLAGEPGNKISICMLQAITNLKQWSDNYGGTVVPSLPKPQISGCSDYPASISVHSIQRSHCKWSKVAILDTLKGGKTTQRCQTINCLKPEQAKLRQAFAPTIDSMIGKEMAVLIMIHYRPYLHPKGVLIMTHSHVGWFTYPAKSLHISYKNRSIKKSLYAW